MCEYCGCQQITVIRELTDEHERLRDLGADLVAAARRRDRPAAATLARQMLDILGPHTVVEELGLFVAMADDFGPQLDDLSREHRQIDAVLSAFAAHADPAPRADDWLAQVEAAVGQLFEHILKEQDGVFPAALASLSSDSWESVAAVRSAQRVTAEVLVSGG